MFSQFQVQLRPQTPPLPGAPPSSSQTLDPAYTQVTVEWPEWSHAALDETSRLVTLTDLRDQSSTTTSLEECIEKMVNAEKGELPDIEFEKACQNLEARGLFLPGMNVMMTLKDFTDHIVAPSVFNLMQKRVADDGGMDDASNSQALFSPDGLTSTNLQNSIERMMNADSGEIRRSDLSMTCLGIIIQTEGWLTMQGSGGHVDRRKFTEVIVAPAMSSLMQQRAVRAANSGTFSPPEWTFPCVCGECAAGRESGKGGSCRNR